MTRFERLPWSREQRRDGSFKNRETSEVMEPIRETCRRLHLRCERNQVGKVKGASGCWMMLHAAGTWDLEVYIPDAGCTAMVECKMPGEGLEPAQAEWGKVYRACGKETIVASSVYEFLVALDEIRERRRKWSASRTS